MKEPTDDDEAAVEELTHDQAHDAAIERLEQLCRHLLDEHELVQAQLLVASREKDDAVASEAMAEEMCEQATVEAKRLKAELSRLHRDRRLAAEEQAEAEEQEAAEAAETERSLRLAAEEREQAAAARAEAAAARAEAEAQRAVAAEARADAAAEELAEVESLKQAQPWKMRRPPRSRTAPRHPPWTI